MRKRSHHRWFCGEKHLPSIWIVCPIIFSLAFPIIEECVYSMGTKTGGEMTLCGTNLGEPIACIRQGWIMHLLVAGTEELGWGCPSWDHVSTSRLLSLVGGWSLRVESWLRLSPGSLLDFKEFIVQILVKKKKKNRPTQEPGTATQVWHLQ